MTRERAKKYKHEVRVTETGALQARCYENGVPHWEGGKHEQQIGLAKAHTAANAELNSHVEQTGHTSFKQRHGGAR